MTADAMKRLTLHEAGLAGNTLNTRHLTRLLGAAFGLRCELPNKKMGVFHLKNGIRGLDLPGGLMAH
jgi:hypothetical protein